MDVTYGAGRKTEFSNAMDVIMTSLEIMGQHHFESVTADADVLIQPAVGHINPKEFDRSREIVDLGRRAAEEKLTEIKTNWLYCPEQRNNALFASHQLRTGGEVPGSVSLPGLRIK